MSSQAFYEVSPESLKEYVRENNLQPIGDLMYQVWVNDTGDVMARQMHGFARDICEICDAPNEGTMAIVRSLLNRKL